MADEALITDLLPEWAAFRDTTAHRNPSHGTACAAWTTRDIIAHQAGNAVELGRVLERGLDEPDAWVPRTGRQMKVAWFGEHMRSEMILHRWDLVGDDDQANAQLAQPWMTRHTVDAVGVPLLRRGNANIPQTPFTCRLRVANQPDVVLNGGAQPTIGLTPADPDTQADVVTDAAARVLLLWGRQPADTTRLHSEVGPERLGRCRALLSGY